MKYLSEIMEEKQSQLFAKYKVFFAFSDKQFKEGMDKYNLTKQDKIINMGKGMFCPSNNVKAFIDKHHLLYKLSIAKDMLQGKDKVIYRELSNHECFWSGDITDCVEKLSDYPITKEDIINVFQKNYQKESLKF
jgi:hypothetical protein